MADANYISIAAESDIPALVSLVNSAYRGEGSKKGWTTEADLLDGLRTNEKSLQEIIAKPGSVILIYTDEKNKLVGCVNLQQQENKLYLGMLTVSPILQGAGIGKKLLAASESYAASNNFTAITMTVISVRQELIAWYERHGYQRTGETKPFPTEDPHALGAPRIPLEFIYMEKRIVAN